MKTIEVKVSQSQYPLPHKLTKEDVWGKYDDPDKPGMVIAHSGQICPIWKDKVPYKSVTVLVPIDNITEVAYWLEYVHGANCIVRSKRVSKTHKALRSDYQCW